MTSAASDHPQIRQRVLTRSLALRERKNIACQKLWMIARIVPFMTMAPGSLHAQVVRDSSSVRIVTYTEADAPQEMWRIEEPAILTIDATTTPGAGEFFMIAGLLRLADGSIAVADGSSREIRIFDASGQLTSTLGGRGRGPGEFNSLWELWQFGDNLVGVDGVGGAQEFVLTRGEWKHVRTVVPLMSKTAERISRRGYLAAGALIGTYIEREPEPKAGVSTQFARLTKQGRDSNEYRSLNRFPASEIVRLMDGGRPSSIVYGPRIRVGVLSNGYCVGYSDNYEFQCFDAEDALTTRVIRPWKRVQVTEEARQLFFEGIDIANPGPRGAAYRQEVRESSVFADHIPPFGRFLVSEHDELWIGPLVLADETLGVLNPSPPGPTAWAVYNSNGEWLAEIALPARFRAMDVGAEYVLGVMRDSEDVERVVMYRLLRK